MDNLSAASEIELNAVRALSDEELAVIVGGRKAGESQYEFIKVTLQDLIISDVGSGQS